MVSSISHASRKTTAFDRVDATEPTFHDPAVIQDVVFQYVFS